jgi:chorismate-pyruvate lyase
MSEVAAQFQSEGQSAGSASVASSSALNGQASAAPGLLYPLDEFYRRAGLVIPPAALVEGADVPEPYRSLLVHDRDMTPTLEKFHAERIHLRTIGRRLDGDALSRLVVLTTSESGKPVEFGAIVIHLEQFPAEARPVILECRVPLGTILAEYSIEHYSRPTAFLRVSADPLINGSLATAGTEPLYGRRNVLKTPAGHALADVIEILPPV